MIVQRGKEASSLLQMIQGQHNPPVESRSWFSDKEQTYGSRVNSYRRSYYPGEGEPKRTRFDVE